MESQAVLNELVHRGILVRTRPISEGVCTLMLCSRMYMLAQPQVCPYPCIPTPSAYAFYCNAACCNALQYYMWMRSVNPPLHARAHSCAQREDCSATKKTYAAVSKMLEFTGSHLPQYQRMYGHHYAPNSCMPTHVCQILHQRRHMDGNVYGNVHRLQGSSKLDHSVRLL